MVNPDILRPFLDLLIKPQAGAGSSQPASAPAPDAIAGIIRMLGPALAGGSAGGTLGGTPGQPSIGSVLQQIIAASAGKAAVPGSDGAAPILSNIDKLLGGEALAGKKTMISIIGYVIVVALQVAGALTPGGAAANIVTTLLAVFGGLGGAAKVDRVVQALSLIAAKPK